MNTWIGARGAEFLCAPTKLTVRGFNMLKKKIFLFAVLFFSMVSIAGNTIAPPTQERLRCDPDDELTKEECEDDRRHALEVGCISQADLNILISYNGCPKCDYKRGKYSYVGWCTQGCFVRGTKVLVWDINIDKKIWAPIEEIVYKPARFRVAALRSDSTRSNLVYDFFPIRLTTFGPEAKPLVSIQTQDGGKLGITTDHGAMLSNGTLVAAEMLRVGDKLLAEGGKSLEIVDIARPNSDDDVFNLSVETDSNISHLIIAEGFVVGDQFLQGSRVLNSTILE